MATINYYTPIYNIEDKAHSQIKAFENKDDIIDISIFPDVHYCAEKMIPVGLSFSTKNVIYPLITGKDMGCGVAYIRIPKTDVIKSFDKDKHYKAFHKAHLEMTDEGLGGGNHFLSLEEDNEALYIIVHTGTRNRGIYMFQRNLALLKESGNDEYLPIDFLEKNYPEWFPEYNDVLEYGRKRRLEFLEGTLQFLERNGYINRNQIYETGDSIHNHIKKEGDLWIHRKGATELGNQVVVIPLSMTRGSLFVKKSHEFKLLNSCSHGAGRRLSRTDTLKFWHSLKKKERKLYEEQFCELIERNGKFSQGYIQEFDFAYKDSTNLLCEQPFLQKVYETKPICTIKFSEI